MAEAIPQDSITRMKRRLLYCFICICKYQLFLCWTKIQKYIGSLIKGESSGVVWRIWILEESMARKASWRKSSMSMCRCNKWKFIRHGMWETIWVSKRPHYHWSKNVGWQSKWLASSNKKVFIHLDRSSSPPVVSIQGHSTEQKLRLVTVM